MINDPPTCISIDMDSAKMQRLMRRKNAFSELVLTVSCTDVATRLTSQ